MLKNKSIVLIPHFNAVDDLIKSIKSIDSNENIDVLIVDDGSKKKPNESLLKENYSATGELTLLLLNENVGIEEALNTGLKYIVEKGYSYVARLDAGDLALPQRFKKQEEFLEKNKDYALVGSWVQFVDVEGKEIFVLKHPTNDAEIRNKAIMMYNPFVHPATMYTLESAKKVGFYPTTYKALEDWAFFTQIVKQFKAANLPEVLTVYEVNPNSISSKKRRAQSWGKIKLLLNNPRLSIYWFAGLIKSVVIFFISRELLTKIKAKIK